MSYDPSHRMPPPQRRWPSATPAEAWPAHQDATAGPREFADRGYQPAQADAYARAGYGGSGYAGTGYRSAENGGGYGGADHGGYNGTGYNGTGYNGTGYKDAGYNGNGGAGYRAAGTGYADDGYRTAGTGYADDGYAGGTDEFAGRGNDGYGWDDSAWSDTGGWDGTGNGTTAVRDDFAGQAGYLGDDDYGQDFYTEPAPTGLMLAAPDVGVRPGTWHAEQDWRREARRRGLAVGAVTGFLAVAVAIGVSTLAAGFTRAPASPVGAVGGVFVDRMPASLRTTVAQHSGHGGQTMLLFGMYVLIALLAIAIGVLSRRSAALGVASLAACGLFTAFVVITRPGARVADVIPVIIGGLAGVLALLWLVRASAPSPGVTSLRHSRGAGRRRAR